MTTRKIQIVLDDQTIEERPMTEEEENLYLVAEEATPE